MQRVVLVCNVPLGENSLFASLLYKDGVGDDWKVMKVNEQGR